MTKIKLTPEEEQIARTLEPEVLALSLKLLASLRAGQMKKGGK